MQKLKSFLINILITASLLGAPDPEALQIIKRVITNQESVNLTYETETTISFYSIDWQLKPQRNLISRYYVHKGRIIKGERLKTSSDTKTSKDFPQYRENKILPLFSPLSWQALPLYSFKYIGNEIKNGIETIKISYYPKEKSKDLSYGNIWISKTDTDLVALEMIASIPFTFTEYFIMEMDYIKVSGVWVPDVIYVQLGINFLGIYRRNVIFDQRVIKRHF